MAKKSLFKIIAAVVIIALAAAALNKFSQQQPQEENATLSVQYTDVILFPQNAKPFTIKAEVADTDGKRTTGLMFRKALGKDEGMLFVFTDAAVRNFWMKNTVISLDMIFIAENGTIMKIRYAEPCNSEPCKLYSSEKPIRYVLEVNGNLTTEKNITEGSFAAINLPD